MCPSRVIKRCQIRQYKIKTLILQRFAFWGVISAGQGLFVSCKNQGFSEMMIPLAGNIEKKEFVVKTAGSEAGAGIDIKCVLLAFIRITKTEIGHCDRLKDIRGIKYPRLQKQTGMNELCFTVPPELPRYGYC